MTRDVRGARRRLRWGALLLLASGLPAHGLAGYTISEQVDVRRQVHRNLERMGRIPPGPHYEQEMDRKVDEMAREVGALADLALASLGHFLRNPEEAFGECAVAYAIPRFAAGAPGRAVEILIEGIPAPSEGADRCLVDAAVRLGPEAYPHLARCASAKRASRSWFCLRALLEQSRGVPGLDQALGLCEGGEPPARRAEIRRAAAGWEVWWEERRAGLRWNPATRRLEETEP